MNGRCDNDPLDRAENICEKCGGDYCDACLLYPRGKKRAPICKACAIAHSGVRSTSKSTTALERKNVRKRRKELKEQDEDVDNGAFIFFDEEGSDIVLRDPSVLEPDEEEASPKRFAKKAKTKSEADKAKKTDKPKKAKSAAKKKKVKSAEKSAGLASEPETIDAVAGTASSDMPPPPSSEDAVVDENETVDLGMALSGYDVSENEDAVELEADPFGDADDDVAAIEALTGVPVAEAPVAETPVAGNDSPSATELLARLHEAENARKTEPEIAETTDDSDPWIPAAMASPATPFESGDDFDSTVSPFGQTTPEREPMEAWVPPSVTPDAAPLTSDSDFEEPSLDYGNVTASTETDSFEPAAFDEPAPFESPSPLDEPVAEQPAFLDEQPFELDGAASFKHDPAFANDSFDSTDFVNDAAFGIVEEEPAWGDEPGPLEIVIHAPEPSNEHEPAFADTPVSDTPFADSPSSDSGSVATATKADTDDDGNWVPPALRGMLPKAERDADVLPKRRDDD